MSGHIPSDVLGLSRLGPGALETPPGPAGARHPPVAHLAGVVQAVLLHVGLEVGGAAEGAALRAAVRRLVRVGPLVRAEAALVGQQHLAHGARLGESRRERLTQARAPRARRGSAVVSGGRRLPWDVGQHEPPPRPLSFPRVSGHRDAPGLATQAAPLPFLLGERPDPVFPKTDLLTGSGCFFQLLLPRGLEHFLLSQTSLHCQARPDRGSCSRSTPSGRWVGDLPGGPELTPTDGLQKPQVRLTDALTASTPSALRACFGWVGAGPREPKCSSQTHRSSHGQGPGSQRGAPWRPSWCRPHLEGPSQ